MERFSGANFCFLSVVVGLVFFDSVLPRLLFFYLFFCSRKCLGKFSECQVRCLKNFRERTFVFGVGVGRVLFWCCFAYVFCSIVWFFALEKILLMSGLVFLVFFWIGCPEFFGEVFRALKCPIFAAQKPHVKALPFLVFFSIFVTRWFLEGFGARAPLLVLEMFLVGSGCAYLYGFCIRYREFFPPFLGSGASLLFSSSLPFSSSSFSSGGRPG